MNNHKKGIAILGIVISLVCVIGIYLIGTPISKREINLDELRLSDFNTYNFRIRDYYQTHRSLPLNMTDLQHQYGQTPFVDPETGKLYDYSRISSTRYNLCTTFSTSSDEVNKLPKSFEFYQYEAPTKAFHPKGYYCISYDLPPYLITPTPYMMPLSPPVQRKIPLNEPQ